MLVDFNYEYFYRNAKTRRELSILMTLKQYKAESPCVKFKEKITKSGRFINVYMYDRDLRRYNIVDSIRL